MSEFTQLNDAVNNNNDIDIISTLPETLISRILSLLPTKEAVQTCILSKDWEHKWIEIDNIDTYYRGQASNTHRETFSNFINKILRLSPIKRVRIDNYFQVKVPDINCFSHLKKIYVQGVDIWNARYPNPRSRLVFTFPVLESLELESFGWIDVESLEFDAPVLKTFKANDCDFTEGICKIKLYGDTIETFEASDLVIEHMVLTESSTIGDAKSSNKLSSDKCYGLQARALLKGVSILQHLNLSAAVFKGLSRTKGELSLPRFSKLKSLEICIERNNEALLELLHAAPSLKRLIINTESSSNVDYELEFVPRCVVSCLKEVEFPSFGESIERNRLAKYFMKNAPKLTKLSLGCNDIVLGNDEEVKSRNKILSSAKN